MPPSEADKLIKEFFNIAKKSRKSGMLDFAEIAAAFVKKLTHEEGYDGVFAKKLASGIKEFLASDPRYQRSIHAY